MSLQVCLTSLAICPSDRLLVFWQLETICFPDFTRLALTSQNQFVDGVYCRLVQSRVRVAAAPTFEILVRVIVIMRALRRLAFQLDR